jgi:flagellar basal body-associated protein FliL
MDAKFEIEGELDEDVEDDEELEEEESRSVWVYILLAVFILLFLISSSLLVYYQFYKGQGHFEWSLQKKNAVVADTNITNLKLQHDSALTQLDSLKNIVASSQSLFTANTTGEVYYVQIGAFRNINFAKYSQNMVNMFVEVTDGVNKLIIGGFTNFDDACSFRKDIVRIGIKDAFIVKKVNGERVKFRQWCQ